MENVYWPCGSYPGDAHEEYGAVLLRRDLDSEAPPFFDGRRYGDTPINLELKLTPGPIFDVVDFLPEAICFTEHAVRELKPYLDSEVEFLKVKVGLDKVFYIVNVIKILFKLSVTMNLLTTNTPRIPTCLKFRNPWVR